MTVRNLCPIEPDDAAFERPDSYDWEVLGDAEADYRDWLEMHPSVRDAIDHGPAPANDNSLDGE